jgi:hypothetical protein
MHDLLAVVLVSILWCFIISLYGGAWRVSAGSTHACHRQGGDGGPNDDQAPVVLFGSAVLLFGLT